MYRFVIIDTFRIYQDKVEINLINMQNINIALHAIHIDKKLAYVVHCTLSHPPIIATHAIAHFKAMVLRILRKIQKKQNTEKIIVI